MNKPIPFTESMRADLIERHQNGSSELELARHFKVSKSTIRRWLVRDDVECYIANYACAGSPIPHDCTHYRGFALHDLVKLTRYVEAYPYRLKIGEQLCIQRFDLKARTADSERLRSWAPRHLAMRKFGFTHVGVPWIGIPVSAFTTDYEFTPGDCAYIKSERVLVRSIDAEQDIALVELENGHAIEIPTDLINPSDQLCDSVLAPLEWVCLEKQEVQIKGIRGEIVTVQKVTDELEQYGREVEFPITLLTSRWVERDGAIPFHSLGEEKLKLRDYEGAMSEFESAAKKNPGFAEALVGLGVALTLLHGNGAGLDRYCAAIRVDRTTALAYFKRCVSNYQLTSIQEQDIEIADCYIRHVPHSMSLGRQDVDNLRVDLKRAKRAKNHRLVAYIENWLEHHENPYFFAFEPHHIPRPKGENQHKVRIAIPTF
ncbi:MAG: hypothetical protein OXP71_05810 [Candidatus Poribacteria bacterium]|nr:hypothetical protein [Candidatus Poribacteria bacterium]